MTTSSIPQNPSSGVPPRGMAIALNAVRNGSSVAATPADIERILATGRGEGSLVRARVGDVSLDALSWLAIDLGIGQDTLLAAYATANAEAAAANPELDALIRRPAGRRRRPSS